VGRCEIKERRGLQVVQALAKQQQRGIIAYRCDGIYRGRTCERLLCRAQQGIELEIRCGRCKKLNIFRPGGTQDAAGAGWRGSLE